MRIIIGTRLNRFYLRILRISYSIRKDYILRNLRKGEEIYVYKNKGSILPLGIIVGHFLFPGYFELEYIWSKSKRKGIGQCFLKEFLTKYKVETINYRADSDDGRQFFAKMKPWFKEKGIKDAWYDKKEGNHI